MLWEQPVSKIQEQLILPKTVWKVDEEDFWEFNKFTKLLHWSWVKLGSPAGVVEEDDDCNDGFATNATTESSPTTAPGGLRF